MKNLIINLNSGEISSEKLIEISEWLLKEVFLGAELSLKHEILFQNDGITFVKTSLEDIELEKDEVALKKIFDSHKDTKSFSNHWRYTVYLAERVYQFFPEVAGKSFSVNIYSKDVTIPVVTNMIHWYKKYPLDFSEGYHIEIKNFYYLHLEGDSRGIGVSILPITKSSNVHLFEAHIVNHLRNWIEIENREHLRKQFCEIIEMWENVLDNEINCSILPCRTNYINLKGRLLD